MLGVGFLTSAEEKDTVALGLLPGAGRVWMSKRSGWLCILGVLVVGGALSWAQEDSYIAFPQDKGPDTLDVSAYPKEIQEGYKLFSKKCSRCHTLARPLNTSMDNRWWASYMGNMVKRPRYGLTDKDAVSICAFLLHDQENRKAKNPAAFHPALTEEEIIQLRLQQSQE